MEFKLLSQCSSVIPQLAQIWRKELGQAWLPDIDVDKVEAKLKEHTNSQKIPLMYVALIESLPVGICSLRYNDGIWHHASPWLGSLVVSSNCQRQGVGTGLVRCVTKKVTLLGFNKLYLFAFDKGVLEFYSKLGWSVCGKDYFRGHSVTVMQYPLL